MKKYLAILLTALTVGIAGGASSAWADDKPAATSAAPAAASSAVAAPASATAAPSAAAPAAVPGPVPNRGDNA